MGIKRIHSGAIVSVGIKRIYSGALVSVGIKRIYSGAIVSVFTWGDRMPECLEQTAPMPQPPQGGAAFAALVAWK